MKHRSTSPGRLAIGAAALALVAGSGLACSSSSATEAASATAGTAEQAMKRPPPAERPTIENLSVELVRNAPPGMNARLLATVSRGSEPTIAAGTFTLQPDPGDPRRDIVFTNDGKGADDKAGDLVFSAFHLFDFDELRRQNDRIHRLGGPRAVSVTTFDGRVAVKAEPPALVDLSTVVPGNPIDIGAVGLAGAISVEESLIITHPDVIQDKDRTFNRCRREGTPMGKWTFGHLFSEMINQPMTGVDPRQAALHWLDSWNHNQEQHFNSAVPRPGVQQFINEWRSRSNSKLPRLDQAPFQLVAIVNRMDLHESVGYSDGNAGELRFVFALEDANCNPLPMLVIFEYGNLPVKCGEIQHLARRWVDLASHPIGSVAYNTVLEDLTNAVVNANAAPHKVNGSALNQLRTNDFVFARPWQLREFILHKKTSMLEPETVKRTPDIAHENVPFMRAGLAFAIDNNLPSIWPNPPPSMPNMLTGSFDPLEFPTGFFIRAMASDIPHPGFCFTPKLAGNTAISGNDARFEYSSNTCAGCHGGDLNANGDFTHIDEHGNLSQFLSGPMTALDCTNGGITRNFDEPKRRAQVLDALATNACVRIAAMGETKAEH